MVGLVGVLALAAGCARKTPPATPAAGAAPAGKGPVWAPVPGTNQTQVAAPESVLVGKVATVNTPGRFVVLSFPIGKMAAVDQRLNLYRHGLKVGEVKVTGPQRENNIVADLLTGEAQAGDEARTQ